MIPSTNTITTTTANQPKTVCGECGTEEQKLLHNICLGGNIRHLCTTCVLHLRHRCFCPSCLFVYERSPPEDAIVCFKCSSYSHPNCLSLLPAAGLMSSSRGPSPCSSCLNPYSLKLSLNRLENGCRVIDHNAARLLLAAGKIASMTMNKAEVDAAMEAEKRSKEAVYTKKLAREALDHVVKLMGKEKINNVMNESSNNNSKKVFHGAIPYVAVNNNKVDPSNEFLEALNAVELKDSGRQVQGGSVESVVMSKMDVYIEHSKELVVNSIAENGFVKSDR